MSEALEARAPPNRNFQVSHLSHCHQQQVSRRKQAPLYFRSRASFRAVGEAGWGCGRGYDRTQVRVLVLASRRRLPQWEAWQASPPYIFTLGFKLPLRLQERSSL